MATTKAASGNASLRGITVAALLFGVWSLPALASSGIEVDCNAVEDLSQTKTLPVADLTLTVDVDRSIEQTVDEIETDALRRESVRFAPTSNEVKTSALAKSRDSRINERDSVGTSSGNSGPLGTTAPDTATRLPGLSEADRPRIRRRMYRTDI